MFMIVCVHDTICMSGVPRSPLRSQSLSQTLITIISTPFAHTTRAHTIENTVKIAKSTEQKMHQLKTIASSSGGVSMSVTDVDQPKFLYEKLKKEFTRCMTKFKQVTDSLQKKQKDFVVRAKKTVQKQRIGSTDAQDGPSALDERTHLLQTQKFQEENFLLENAIQHNESLIAEREEEILDIESNILEINDIFRELNIMVHEQGGHLSMRPELAFLLACPI